MELRLIIGNLNLDAWNKCILPDQWRHVGSLISKLSAGSHENEPVCCREHCPAMCSWKKPNVDYLKGGTVEEGFCSGEQGVQECLFTCLQPMEEPRLLREGRVEHQ